MNSSNKKKNVLSISEHHPESPRPKQQMTESVLVRVWGQQEEARWAQPSSVLWTCRRGLGVTVGKKVGEAGGRSYENNHSTAAISNGHSRRKLFLTGSPNFVFGLTHLFPRTGLTQVLFSDTVGARSARVTGKVRLRLPESWGVCSSLRCSYLWRPFLPLWGARVIALLLEEFLHCEENVSLATWSFEGPSTINFTLCKENHFLKFLNQTFLKIKMS